jgi:multidrug resistance efflux pump
MQATEETITKSEFVDRYAPLLLEDSAEAMNQRVHLAKKMTGKWPATACPGWEREAIKSMRGQLERIPDDGGEAAHAQAEQTRDKIEKQKAKIEREQAKLKELEQQLENELSPVQGLWAKQSVVRGYIARFPVAAWAIADELRAKGFEVEKPYQNESSQ